MDGEDAKNWKVLYGSEEALQSGDLYRYYSLQEEAAGIKLSDMEEG